MKENIINRFLKGDQRTALAKKNIVLSFFIKGVSIILSLVMVPLTIGYVTSTQYGLWLTISSILGWFSYFDMGLTHGFRNKFAEAKAKNDVLLARQYLSTTYITMVVIFTVVFIVFGFVNCYIDWAQLLNVEENMNTDLRNVCFVVLFFFCVNMILRPISTLIIADQKPAYASFIDMIGQLLVLVTIFLLTKTVHGSLFILALVVSSVPVIVLLITSLVLYNGYYRLYKPSLALSEKNKVKDIVGLGGKFFMIQISSIFVFQAMNLLISNTKGPESVTVFNIAYKYFFVFNMLFSIVVSPFWTAFTDAFTKGDFNWMKNVYSKLCKSSYIMIVAVVIALILSNVVYSIWLGDLVEIPLSVSIAMALYIISTILGCVPVTLLNGVGYVKVQMYVHVFYAVITVPILLYLFKNFEMYIGLLFAAFNPLTHFIVCSIQIRKILNRTSYGIWNE